MGLGVMRSEKNYQTIVKTTLPPAAARETRNVVRRRKITMVDMSKA